MPSIDSILKSAAPEPAAPDGDVVDADLARGRAALVCARRRRRRRGLSTAAGALAIGGVAAAIVGVSTSASTSHGAAGGSVDAGTGGAVTRVGRPADHRPSRVRVQLVAYTGAQLPGFTVARIPKGWHLSSSVSDALCITRDGSTNNDPNAFVGKLAVLTSSTDQTGLGDGDPVTVNGRAGRVSRQSGILMLDYTTPSGFGVDIQAPGALHWSGRQLVAFADGVRVTANAVHSHG